ncbi:ABC transporter substrate-binding protein [Actinoalloteichus hymeniacidonis]|uniref:ABC-type dipeptide transport system, periplasmic component n=1 Tax=Actinoalloteichus hymeniacidonis TaxID=340345 RepID=A0AAC9MZU3_9PSEU|nr:ABC transporter substrate-binding protein [Actinoalloteichus hymeniacidonis]AOS64725.1 ABC-type dipeptide transport system, periplasmic component [Actinoalloteichus hymeniacidonis]MBB5907199.1 peptide/nickel transport system substrate-binding protein [Actinoalloteichus hymeniacidonis]
MLSSVHRPVHIGRSRAKSGLAAMLVLACTATTACSVANSDSAGDAGDAGDSLRIVLAQEPPTLEPCEASLTSTGVVTRSNISEPLIERDPTTGELEPLLATEWEQDSDTEWTLQVRDDVTFHDGAEFTAEDAAFSIDRAVNSTLACNVEGYVFGDDDLGIEVVDDTTLTITTARPDPILPLRLSFIEVVPRTTSTEAKVREPIGTGPYAVASWETGVSINLQRHDDYWGEAPDFGRVRYVWRSESSVRAAMIATDEADIATALNPEDATEENSLPYPNNETTALRLDGTQAPLDDLRVRKAIGLAVDRHGIVDALFDGLAQPAAQLVPEGVVGYNPELTAAPADPEAARALVEEAADDGVPVDREITLIARNDMFPRVAETAEALQYQLAEIGLQVKIQMADTAAHLEYQLRPFPEDVGPVALLIMHGNQAGDAGFTTSQYLISDGPQSTFGTDALDEQVAEADEALDDERQDAFAEVFAEQNESVAQYAHLAHMQGLLGISPRVSYEPNSATGDEMRLADIRSQR